jgi:hypothetical protein
MKLITQQTRADEAAKRWKEQYFSRKHEMEKDKEIIYKNLLALGENPDPDMVNKVIGNSSWTNTPDCSECGLDDNTPRIQAGEEPDYESQTAYLCEECIKKAHTCFVRKY